MTDEILTEPEILELLEEDGRVSDEGETSEEDISQEEASEDVGNDVVNEEMNSDLLEGEENKEDEEDDDDEEDEEDDAETNQASDTEEDDESGEYLEELPVEKINRIIQAALLAAGEPMTIKRMLKLFKRPKPENELLKTLLKDLQEEYDNHDVLRLIQTAAGYQFQLAEELSPWISRVWEQKPPRYSRALLETLSLIAYRQPITRGEIEQVRGVAVSNHIIKTLLDRGWIQVIGQRDVPGRPSLFGTTKAFLDYFNLKRLAELPDLPEIRNLLEEKQGKPQEDEPIQAVLPLDAEEVDAEVAHDAEGDDEINVIAESELAEQADEIHDMEADIDVVTVAEADEGTEFDTVVIAEVNTDVKIVADGEDELELDSTVECMIEAEDEFEHDNEVEAELHAELEPSSDIQAEPEFATTSELDSVSEFESDLEFELDFEPEANVQTEVVAELESELETESELEAQPEDAIQ